MFVEIALIETCSVLGDCSVCNCAELQEVFLSFRLALIQGVSWLKIKEFLLSFQHSAKKNKNTQEQSIEKQGAGNTFAV